MLSECLPIILKCRKSSPAYLSQGTGVRRRSQALGDARLRSATVDVHGGASGYSRRGARLVTVASDSGDCVFLCRRRKQLFQRVQFEVVRRLCRSRGLQGVQIDVERRGARCGRRRQGDHVDFDWKRLRLEVHIDIGQWTEPNLTSYWTRESLASGP